MSHRRRGYRLVAALAAALVCQVRVTFSSALFFGGGGILRLLAGSMKANGRTHARKQASKQASKTE